MIDSRSALDLFDQTLKKWSNVVVEMERLGIPVALVSTFRDWEMQAYLYTLGRTRSGSIVTHVGPGGSFHNVRRGIDAWPLNPKTGKLDAAFVDSAAAAPLFKEYGRVGKMMELQWGGDWPKGKTDRPHLQDGYCATCATIFTTARHFKEDGTCAVKG